MAETTKSNPVPQEVKDFIKYLSDGGLYKLYDLQKGYVYYNSSSRSTLPSTFIKDQFKDYCKILKWTEYSYYVEASIEAISGTYFKPNGDKLVGYTLGEQKLNTYFSYKPKSEESDCPLFIELLERLAPVDNERKIFTQWLAHIIQRPEERPTWAVMMTSDEGVGKGVLYHHIITPLLMKQSRQCSTYKQLLGDQSTVLVDSLFVMLDDTKTKSDSTITELKSKISEGTLWVNPKYLQPYNQKVYSRMLLASNETRPIKISNQDTRRWLALQYIKHKVSLKETAYFCKRLINWLSNEHSLDKVYNYLNTLCLDDFNPHKAYKAETLEMMVEMSESTKESDVREWCEKNPVFKLDELRREFIEYPDLAKTYASNFTVIKKLANENGKRTRYWVSKELSTKEANLIINPVLEPKKIGLTLDKMESIPF